MFSLDDPTPTLCSDKVKRIVCRKRIGDKHFVCNQLGGHKLVRSVGRFRDGQSGGGIVGVTYEFVERLRVVGFEDDTTPR